MVENKMLKRVGARTHPCLTPFCSLNGDNDWPLSSTLACTPLWNWQTMVMKLRGYPYLALIFHNSCLLTVHCHSEGLSHNFLLFFFMNIFHAFVHPFSMITGDILITIFFKNFSEAFSTLFTSNKLIFVFYLDRWWLIYFIIHRFCLAPKFMFIFI